MSRRVKAVASGLAAIALLGVVAVVARDRERKPLDQAARAAAPGKFVRLSGGTTHYELTGPETARTVVLLTGASVPFYLWDPTRDALVANGFRVLRYDYFGRGFSDRPELRYDLASYERQLAELLDSLHVRGPLDVAGASMGAVIAAHFADRRPERVRSLTLVAPPFGLMLETPLLLRIPGVAELVMTVGAPEMAKGQRDDFLHPERYPHWVERYEVQMQYDGFRRSMLETVRGDVFKRPARSFTRLSGRGIPMLILWGKADRTVPFSRSDSVRAAFPRSEFHAIDDAAHLPQIEQASTVNSVILNFLRRS
jgi:pimeloyl-ACP methyl ester carboxylesterase